MQSILSFQDQQVRELDQENVMFQRNLQTKEFEREKYEMKIQSLETTSSESIDTLPVFGGNFAFNRNQGVAGPSSTTMSSQKPRIDSQFAQINKQA